MWSLLIWQDFCTAMSVAMLKCALESIRPVWLQDKICTKEKNQNEKSSIWILWKLVNDSSSNAFITSIAISIQFWLTLNRLLDDMLAKWPDVLHRLIQALFGRQLFVQSPPSSNKINADHVAAFYIWIKTKGKFEFDFQDVNCYSNRLTTRKWQYRTHKSK